MPVRYRLQKTACRSAVLKTLHNNPDNFLDFLLHTCTEMKKHLLLYTGVPLLLFMVVTAFGLTPKGNTSKLKLRYADDGKGLLWEISGNGLKHPSFLYGTIHIRDKRVFAYDRQVQKAFDACDAYAMELLTDSVNPTDVARWLRMKDTTLEMLLSPADLRELDDTLRARLHTGYAFFNTTQPFFLAAQLSLAGMNEEMPVLLDLYFDEMAKAQEKSRFGIEKFSDQAAVVRSIPLKDQAEDLLKVLRDTTGKAGHRELLTLYMAGDVHGILNMESTEMGSEAFQEQFLWNRNVNMANKIDELIRTQTTFNAIGAAHLGSDRGVIALLRKKGYTLKPVLTPFKSL